MDTSNNGTPLLFRDVTDVKETRAKPIVTYYVILSIMNIYPLLKEAQDHPILLSGHSALIGHITVHKNWFIKEKYNTAMSFRIIHCRQSDIVKKFL